MFVIFYIASEKGKIEVKKMGNKVVSLFGHRQTFVLNTQEGDNFNSSIGVRLLKYIDYETLENCDFVFKLQRMSFDSKRMSNAEYSHNNPPFLVYNSNKTKTRSDNLDKALAESLINYQELKSSHKGMEFGQSVEDDVFAKYADKIVAHASRVSSVPDGLKIIESLYQFIQENGAAVQKHDNEKLIDQLDSSRAEFANVSDKIKVSILGAEIEKASEVGKDVSKLVHKINATYVKIHKVYLESVKLNLEKEINKASQSTEDVASLTKELEYIGGEIYNADLTFKEYSLLMQIDKASQSGEDVASLTNEVELYGADSDL